MKELIEGFFEKEQFIKLSKEIENYSIYFKLERSFINMVLVLMHPSENDLLPENYQAIKNSVEKGFLGGANAELHTLTLIVTNHTEQVKTIMELDKFTWVIDEEEKKLMIYENQITDFYGLRNKIQSWIIGEDKIKKEVPKKLPIAFINAIIIAINVILFFICTFTGDLLYNVGALEGSIIISGREFYRIFTSAFLHADIDHLLSNMLLLYFVGDMIEKNIGHIKYSIIYFFSIIGSAVLSVLTQVFVGGYAASIGASGAVFGLVGALLYHVLRNRGRVQYVTTGKILFLIAYFLYSGFRATNIDNAGHIGGLIAGFFVMALCHIIDWIRKDRSRKI